MAMITGAVMGIDDQHDLDRVHEEAEHEHHDHDGHDRAEGAARHVGQDLLDQVLAAQAAEHQREHRHAEHDARTPAR